MALVTKLKLRYITSNLLVLIPLLHGCQFGDKCKDMAFARLDGVTMVIIKFDNGHSTEKQITDLEHIRRIVNFIKAQDSGWYAPWYGIPVGEFNVELFKGKQFVADFAVGKNYFEAQGCGSFYIRDASSSEVSEALGLFGVD
jgi:hypothetical protein